MNKPLTVEDLKQTVAYFNQSNSDPIQWIDYTTASRSSNFNTVPNITTWTTFAEPVTEQKDGKLLIKNSLFKDTDVLKRFLEMGNFRNIKTLKEKLDARLKELVEGADIVLPDDLFLMMSVALAVLEQTK